MNVSEFLQSLLPLLVPLVLGLVVPYLVDGLKTLSARLDASSALVKNIAAVLVAALTTACTTWLGMGEVAGTVLSWDNATWQTILAAALGIALKRGQQLKARAT